MASRKLVVEIVGDARSLERTLGRATRQTRGFSASLGSIAKSAAVFGGITAGIAGVGVALRSGISEFSDASKAAAQTAAAIKSTGGVANVTAKQVDALASSIQAYSGIDDEAVKSGENLLLTFKNVRNEIGKGNAIFDRATRAAVDLSVAGFGSIESTSKQLGKALNDPIKGMTALGRAGVTFTQSQKDTIKALVETGHTLDAQKLILKEVESQVGGSAKAYGETLPGQLSKLRESLRNTAGDLVGTLAPAFTRGVEAVNDFIERLGKAQTVDAKIKVVVSAITGLGASIAKRVGDAVAKIDWGKVFARARGIADGLQQQLENVDFAVVGQRIGDAFSDAAKVALPAARDVAERLTEAVRTIDWEKLGKSIGPGLAAAVVTAFTTLLDPAFWIRNWDLALAVALTAFGGAIGRVAGRIAGLFVESIAGALARVSPRLAEAFRGLAIQAVRAFGVAFATASRVLGAVFGRLFARLGRLAQFTVKVLGIQAAISAVNQFAQRIIRIFTNLGDSMIAALDRAWEFLKRQAVATALAIVEPFSHIPRRLGGGAFQDLKRSFQGQLAQMETSARSTANNVNASLSGIRDQTVKLTLSIDRTTGRPEEGRAGHQDVANPGAAITGAITKAISVAKAAAKNAVEAAKTTQTVSRAAGTAATNTAKVAKATANTTKAAADSVKRSTGVIVDSADKARKAREAAQAALQRSQFRALGLSATGDTLTPTVRNLRRQLSQLTQRLGSDVSPKIAGQLERVGKVLSGKFGKVTEQTRAKIKELFDTIRSGLSQGADDLSAPLTKTTALSANKILDGLGLGRDAERELRARLSRFNSAGLALAGTGAGARVGAVTTAPVTVEAHTTIKVDSDVVARAVTRSQNRTSRGTRQKRGPNRPHGI